MSEKIVTLNNEEATKREIRELVRGSVEETPNNLLEAEAERLTQAARYERSLERQGYRSGHCAVLLTHKLLHSTLLLKCSLSAIADNAASKTKLSPFTAEHIIGFRLTLPLLLIGWPFVLKLILVQTL